METAHIKEFVVLANHLNYSSAARALFISPSSLSRHINALEGELGIRLLERTSRDVRLTPEGQVLHLKMEALLEDLEESVDAVRQMHATPSFDLRFGVFRGTIALRYAYSLMQGISYDPPPPGLRGNPSFWTFWT